MDLFNQQSRINNTEIMTSWEKMEGCPRTYCRAVQTRLSPNLVSFGVSSSLLFERYLFKRTMHWTRGGSSACWLHRSIMTCTILNGVPGLLQRLRLRSRALNSDLSSLCALVFSAILKDTLCTSKQVRSSAKRPWAQDNVEQVQQSFIHLLQLKWNTVRQLAHVV